MIQVKDLSMSYRTGGQTLTVLNNIHLDIPDKQFLAIIGPSGSGKSTLLGLMAGLDQPTTGSIHLNRIPLTDLDEDGLAILRREKIGIIFQSFYLIPTLTALENVTIPLEMKGDPDAMNRGRELLAAVRLSARENHYPAQLSGGEQQRVAIARAFVCRPMILLADEPTGNLDPSTSVDIMKLLDRINRTGTTVIMATHDNAIVDAMRRRVIELDRGQVVRDQARGVYGYGA